MHAKKKQQAEFDWKKEPIDKRTLVQQDNIKTTFIATSSPLTHTPTHPATLSPTCQDFTILPLQKELRQAKGPWNPATVSWVARYSGRRTQVSIISIEYK